MCGVRHRASGASADCGLRPRSSARHAHDLAVRRLSARKAVVLLAGLLLVLLVAAWAGTHGRWLDPDARLVDGTWIGGPVACPQEVDPCAVMRTAASH